MHTGRNHNLSQYVLTSLLWALLLLPGCQEEVVCEDATATKLRIGFYNKPATGSSTPATIDSLTVYILSSQQDTVYDNRKNVSRIELSLNPNEDISSFVFTFPEATDTFHVHYDRKLHLISVDCGFTMFYSLEELQTTNHRIIQHEITNNLVSNTIDEHIKIYFPAVASSR